MNVIITGVTGMVGEGVLHECLQNGNINKVLVVNRKSCMVQHPKLKEIIHTDFFDLTPIENQLSGYNACFYCLGVTSFLMKEPEYTRITYDLTMYFAGVLSRQNPGMTFCYVSGAGTEAPEKAKFMWARVKGKLEIDLQKLPFKSVYNFRAGFLNPTKGLKNAHPGYGLFSIFYPLFRKMFPKYVSTLQELAQAMIMTAISGYEKPVLEVTDIVKLSKNLTH